MNLFGNKDKKKLDDYKNTISAIPLILLEELKEQFPEEIYWFLAPIDGERVRDIIPSIAVAYGVVTKSIPVKLERKIRRELSKQNPVSDGYAQNYLTYMSKANDQFLNSNPNSTPQEINEIIYYSTGKFICGVVLSMYENTGQKYDFQPDFIYAVGFTLISFFNEALKPFD